MRDARALVLRKIRSGPRLRHSQHPGGAGATFAPFRNSDASPVLRDGREDGRRVLGGGGGDVGVLREERVRREGEERSVFWCCVIGFSLFLGETFCTFILSLQSKSIVGNDLQLV